MLRLDPMWCGIIINSNSDFTQGSRTGLSVRAQELVGLEDWQGICKIEAWNVDFWDDGYGRKNKSRQTRPNQKMPDG